jgi:hypothetical protein
MRKRLAAAAIAAISASGILLASAPAALADTSTCYSEPGSYTCTVVQQTAAGFAGAYSTFYGFNSQVQFANESGYSMNAWVNIDYGNGYVTVWGPVAMPNGDDIFTPDFDDSGFLTQGCFQFTSWSGAAVHCTAGV